MIQRLEAAQIRQVVLDIAAEEDAPARANPAAMAEVFFATAKGNAATRAYGLFGDDLRPHGILVGFIVPDPFSGKLQGVELFWYVQPEHRKGGTAKALLSAFEQDCKQEGCATLVCGLPVDARAPAMRRRYLLDGFKPHTEAFVKEII